MGRPSLFGGEEITLKPEEFRLLRDLVGARTGLNFTPDLRFSLERRLRERLNVLGLATFAEYYQFLRFHPAASGEWEEVQDLLTVNETYFFREDYQLLAFRDEVVPRLAEQARSRRRLSIWSAGCSTGEEVYSIAILLHQSARFEGWDVRVYGFDISKRCIAAARQGVYSPTSFRTTSPELRSRYFTERSDGTHVVERIRALCHFGQLNLLDHDRARLLGRADAVFCRNVLIYYDAHARKRVIDMLHDRLYSGGVLLLGHSESLLNVTTAFELLHLKADLVYRKPDSGGSLAMP